MSVSDPAADLINAGHAAYDLVQPARHQLEELSVVTMPVQTELVACRKTQRETRFDRFKTSSL